MKLTKFYEEYWKHITPEVLLELYKLETQTQNKEGIKIENGDLKERYVKRLRKIFGFETEEISSIEIKSQVNLDTTPLKTSKKTNTRELAVIINQLNQEETPKRKVPPNQELDQLFQQGTSHYRKNNLTPAIDSLEGFLSQVSEVTPSNIDQVTQAHSMLSQAYNKHNKFQKSLDHSKKQKSLLEKELDNPDSYTNPDNLKKWKMGCLGSIAHAHYKLSSLASNPTEKNHLLNFAVNARRQAIEVASGLSYKVISGTEKNTSIGSAYSYIGLYFRKLNDNPQVVENYQKSTNFFQEAIKATQNEKTKMSLELKIARNKAQMFSSLTKNSDKLECARQTIEIYDRRFEDIKTTKGILKTYYFIVNAAIPLSTDFQERKTYQQTLDKINRSLSNIK